MSARTKLLLAQYGLILVVLFLLVGLGALGMAWQTYNDQPTETITEEVDIETYELSSQTEAVVDPAVDPELYEPGEVLVDMPVYFFNESPELTVIVQIDTPDDVTADIDARLTIEYEGARDDQVFWEQVDLLGFEETTVTDGTVEFEGSQDMRDAQEVVSRVQDRVGGAGSVDGRVIVEVDYASERYEGTLTGESELVFTAGAYWLAEDVEASETESRTVTTEVTVSPDMGQVRLFALAGILLILAALVIAGILHRGIDTEQLETDLAKNEHAEWISHGEIPTRGEKEFVGIDSLVDLVDIAIDSNKRVIYDGSIDTYAVVEGDLIYYYSPSREEIEEWLGV